MNATGLGRKSEGAIFASALISAAVLCGFHGLREAKAQAPSAGAAAQAPANPAEKQPAVPRRVDRSKASGIGLPIVKGFTPGRSMAIDTTYAGPQLSVRVMESGSTVAGSSTCLKMNNFPSDAVITVITGRLVLTPENGAASEFVAGDVAILPKGFTGTWEDFGVYRHIIVMANGDPPQLAPCQAAKSG